MADPRIQFKLLMNIDDRPCQLNSSPGHGSHAAEPVERQAARNDISAGLRWAA
jgi:hypothetical protein